MGLFQWLSGKKHERQDSAGATAAAFWDRHPSIYEHVQAHVRPGQKGLTDEGETLPDEKRLAARSGIRWVPGGLDGVMSHHGSGETDPQVEALRKSIHAYCDHPSPRSKQAVYQQIAGGSVIGLIDPLLESLTKTPNLNPHRLSELARSLATQSPDREPVKLGIAILGIYPEGDCTDIFQTLGRHEEFTLFCAVALSNSSEAPENDLWELARNVHGWGRIQTVERLANTKDPRIKQWMLREGYRNSVMDEYLAYVCAQSGGLRAAMEQESVDDQLLTSAGEIIVALLAGGPAKDMSDYDDGAVVVECYLNQLASRASTLKEFLAVSAVKDWIAEKRSDWAALEAKGWWEEKRAAMLSVCEEIMARPQWRELVLADLRSEDEQRFYNADRAASVVGIDAWDYHWSRLQKSPQTSTRWFPVMRACNSQRIGEVVAVAERSLPLDRIATGPASEMGLGKEYGAHSCLDFILQDLGQFPGQGAILVKAGLRSPVVRNRNMAVKTLAEWGKANWPEGMADALKAAVSEEPEEKVKATMVKVLAGKGWAEATAE